MKKLTYLLVAAALLSPLFAQPAPKAPAEEGAPAVKMHKLLRRKRHHHHHGKHAKPSAEAIPVDAPPAATAPEKLPATGHGKKEVKPADAPAS